MNTKTVLALGLCMFGAVSCFAQKKLVTDVTRGIAKACLAPKLNVSFAPKASLSSVVNGYLRTPAVSRFTLPDGQAMRAVRFSRNILIKKEDLLIPAGSLAVVSPAGKIMLYGPEEELPAEIKEGLDAAFEAENPGLLEFMDSWVVEDVAAPSGKPWNGKTSYDAQTDLAVDIDVYYEGQSDEVLVRTIDGALAKVYRIPSANIYYQPAGRAGTYLNPDEDLIIFYFAKGNGAPLSDGQIIFGGVKDTLWKQFFKVRPQ